MVKDYNIAGLLVKMDTFGRTENQAEAYRCDPVGTADIIITSNSKKWKQMYPQMPMDLCEYYSTGVNFYKALLNFNGLMLHSSAVVVDNNAYLFTADSGTGKSTHTKLWLEIFGDRAYLLNDDKPALRFEDGKWYVYGTPWSGKNDISVNIRVPLAGIAVIERGEQNIIERLSQIEAIPKVLRQVNRSKDMASRIKLMDLLDKLLLNVPVWSLKCNMKPDAAIISYEAMSGKMYFEENKNEN